MTAAAAPTIPMAMVSAVPETIMGVPAPPCAGPRAPRTATVTTTTAPVSVIPSKASASTSAGNTVAATATRRASALSTTAHVIREDVPVSTILLATAYA